MNSEELLPDLLSKKALEGLNDEEQERLDELILTSGIIDDSFEAAAAAISMVDLKTTEPLPPHLKAKILADADRVFRVRKELSGQVSYAPRKTSFWARNWLGWAAAAAACLALAVNLWLTRFQPTEIKAPPTVAQLRQNMIETGGDMIRANWTPGTDKDIKEIDGDIVWSDLRQEGYMRFRGLPVNDKDKQTYQLWIFDETQDEKTPIDGGTFDIRDNGDVIIPIKAKLKAAKPKMFAVTVEKPGGVVVSKREKIAAIAKVET